MSGGRGASATGGWRRGARLAGVAVVLLGVAALGVVRLGARGDDADSALLRAAARALRAAERLPLAPPNVDWARGDPERHGLDAAGLAALEEHLADRGTHALLVARDGRLVLESYAVPWRGANARFANAAMAKSVAGALAVLLLWDRGLLAPDDPVAALVPAWRDDPLRSRITVRHLLTHSSGIENVSFQREHEGWKGEYRRDLDGRFRRALERAPVRFAPGSRYEYSGVGFYVLAYAIGRSLAGAPWPDARALLREELMRPLGIPDRAWRLNYGRVSHVDGMALYALGSGAEYTPRALARLGQLLLDRGVWKGRALIEPHHVRAMLRHGGSPPTRDPDAEHPPTGFGTWLNCDGFFPSLPRDAVLGAGADQQLLLVVPSWELVLVRLGDGLGRDDWQGDYWRALEAELLAPLARLLPPPPPLEPDVRCGAAEGGAGAG